MAKRAEHPYRSGRDKSWLKIKCGHEQEFIIVGWSPSTRSRPFSSLLLAVRDKKGLRYAGRVGTGFSNDELDRLSAMFKKLGRKTAPVKGEIPASIARKAHWLRPELVVQIGFAGFTKDGLVRHARYLGLREDKEAAAVTREKATPVEEIENMPVDKQNSPVVAGVPISHPDRVLFPEQGITKIELARYLEKAAEMMMPEIEDRLVSLVRCPEGRQKKCFFQRHAGAGLGDGFQEFEVQGSKEREKYLYITDVKGLVSAAQMGVLEFHIWGSRVDDIERPDRLVFDLDPDPSVSFDEVKKAAGETRDVLDALGLQSFPMLTGGKGIHVIAPLVRRHEWPTVKAFAAAVASRMAEQEPERYVAKMSKAARKGRIFIDYLRNDRTSTAIAPYSPRARAGAPIAWPLSWAELAKAKAANEMTVKTAFSRRRASPWKGYGKLRQSLKISALRALDVER
ncbi:DNA ligase D [Parvibaculum sp.]|uniref:DNA ligase D n=1 Tax=Parvibaculum sp. TaxID=2024848 RepID=UPI0025E6F191|nr:DNA ligase D [Parvibaculum sp.]